MPIYRVGAKPTSAEFIKFMHSTDDEAETRQGETTLNAFSTLFSAAALIVLLTQKRALLFLFQTWVSFIPAVRSASSMQLVHDFTGAIEDTCSVEQLPIAAFDINITRNNETKVYAVMPMAYDVQMVSPALLLIWVLALSSAFQTYCSKLMPALIKNADSSQVLGALLFAHMLLHTAVWVRVFTLQDEGLTINMRLATLLLLTPLCLFIVFYPPKYRNTSADFGRWLEYAMTAPVQVVIVALSVWARDRSTLYALGAAQAAMMLCGVVLEECIQTIYTTNKTDDAEADDANASVNDALRPGQGLNRVQVRCRAYRTAAATLIIAWVSYGLIWYVLGAQFMRQYDITGKCDRCHEYNLTCTNDRNTTEMLAFLDIVMTDYIAFQNKSVVPVFSNVSALQVHDLDILLNVSNVQTLEKLFLLFDLQGMPSFATIMDMVRSELACITCPLVADGGLCVARDGLCQGQNDIPDAVLGILATQGLLFGLFGLVQTVQLFLVSQVRGPEAATDAWYSVALAYALLSVVAKTALEVGFLVMLTQMPEEIDRA